ncbi:hypothetical protein [Candidatus Coxiella mudrowiae]|uniref:hypothetical protein n=1 Tax=Candidatus Coxiella mudrowiae TaxID=2054173 RepID=UPI00138E2CFD|nr:hypothetical protein [Candidatus Coxiella mudrowiae]
MSRNLMCDLRYGFTFLVVPKGIILIRLIPMAAYSNNDIEITLNAFREIGKQFKFI